MEITLDYTFADPAETTIAELAEGDFIVSVPTQDGLRGYTLNSAVRDISEDRWDLYEQRIGRRGRMSVAAREFTTQYHKGVRIAYPSSFKVIARKRMPNSEKKERPSP